MERQVAKLTFDDYRSRNIEIAETARVTLDRHKKANRRDHYDKKLAEVHVYTSLHADNLDGVEAQVRAMIVQEAFPLTVHEPPFNMTLYVETFRKLAKDELSSLKHYE